MSCQSFAKDLRSTSSSSSENDPTTCTSPRIPPAGSQNQIFVGGFGKTDDEVLCRYFQEYGPIEAIQNKGGYGFIKFKDREAAKAAMEKNKNGIMMGGMRVTVDIANSMPEAMKREKRKKRDNLRKKRKRKAATEARGEAIVKTSPDQSLSMI